MKFSAISDVHIKLIDDEASFLFLKFIDESLKSHVTDIFLMGDIFDLMCGPYKQYLKKFDLIFKKIQEALEQNIKVHYFEGNHDFNNKRILDHFSKLSLNGDLFFHYESEFKFVLNGKKIRVSHGDDIEMIFDPQYFLYKKVLMSRLVERTAHYFIPFKLIDHFGSKASDQSRNRGMAKFDYSKQRDKFRRYMSDFIESDDSDIIICGHTHIKEDIELEKNGRKVRYINNGFAPKEKTYILGSEAEIKFINLN